MKIVIWRDSVASQDDYEPPHQSVLSLRSDGTVADMVEKILRSAYLPGIVGGRATWIVEGDRVLAVVAQQWAAPRWLVDPATLVTAARRTAGAPDFRFLYRRQVDPDHAYEYLRAGEPVPDGIEDKDWRTRR
jgi:hypothetical protein